jgi:hypothetical protein
MLVSPISAIGAVSQNESTPVKTGNPQAFGNAGTLALPGGGFHFPIFRQPSSKSLTEHLLESMRNMAQKVYNKLDTITSKTKTSKVSLENDWKSWQN